MGRLSLLSMVALGVFLGEVLFLLFRVVISLALTYAGY
jgi:hypothetical protein